MFSYGFRCEEILEWANIITATGHAYTKGAMFARNRYLVSNADLLLAAYDGKPGRTAMTCGLARRYGVPVMQIFPTQKNAPKIQ